MRQFINIVEKELLTEKFHKGFVSFQGKTCEIFHNPSPKEYKECLAGNDQVRAFLVGDDVLVWNVFSALHQMVREELRLPADSIPLVIYGDLGDVCGALITDNSRNTVWWHNGEVHDVIQSNAYLSRHFIATEIAYYDEDIVGAWTRLDDEEDEEELDESAASKVIVETAEYGFFFVDDNMEPVWELNSRSDLAYALRRTGKNRELRGFVDDDLVVAWDSWKNVHHGVIEDFISYNGEFEHEDDPPEPLRTEWEAMIYLYEDGVAMAPRRGGDIDFVRNHPILKALYGGAVPMRHPRPGTL